LFVFVPIAKEYRQYEAETNRFLGDRIRRAGRWLKGKTLLARENLEKLRYLSPILQLGEGTRAAPALAVSRRARRRRRQAAGGAGFPPELPQGRRLRTSFIERQKQRDHPRQAVVGGWHAGAGLCCRSNPKSSPQQSQQTIGDIRSL